MIDWSAFSWIEFLVFTLFTLMFFLFPNLYLQVFRRIKSMFIKPAVKLPDISIRPDWANYLAQSVNGYWKWYERKPSLNKFGYWTSSSKERIAGYSNNQNYKNSLQAFNLNDIN